MTLDPLKPRLNYKDINHYPRPYNPYPPEYNMRVHGPYDPSRYYGKPKISFWDLKIAEIPRHLWNAEKTMSNITGTASRWFHRHSAKHFRSQTPSMAAPLHLVLMSMFVYYMATYKNSMHEGVKSRKCERRYRYHW